MIQILIFTGLMAIFQIEAVSVQAVHTDEIIIEGVVLLITDFNSIITGALSEKVQVIRECLEIPEVITGDNKMGFSAEGWIL